MIHIEQLLCACFAQEKAFALDKLEGVPRRRIMAGCDDDPATRPEMAGKNQRRRGRHDSGKQGFTANALEPGNDGALDHHAGGSRITANDHGATAHEGAEGLRKGRRHLRREGVANHSTHARHTNFRASFIRNPELEIQDLTTPSHLLLDHAADFVRPPFGDGAIFRFRNYADHLLRCDTRA